MPTNRVLLTGATGLLGRYLLRDLLANGQRVAVLVRDSATTSAAERVAEVQAWCSETDGRSLPAPVVLVGDLRMAHAGLGAADRRWLARNADCVLHAAASLAFHATADGEPWRTNVDGTRHLLELSRTTGILRWHVISTAFVCGRLGGVMRETDCDPAAPFHNVYERSKAEAERLVRRALGVQATIYRPAVIVGDSRTGYTCSYVGLYRFLEMGARLARGRTLRLPLTGDESANLVPVDWVARAIVALMEQAPGRIFHLVSPAPVSVRLIHAVGAAELGLDGVRLASLPRKRGEDASSPRLRGRLAGHDKRHQGPEPPPSDFETQFMEGLREYWPYLDHPASFCAANTTRALPDLAPPRVDAPLLRRLIRFAVADRWGRSAKSRSCTVANAHPDPEGVAEITRWSSARSTTGSRGAETSTPEGSHSAGLDDPSGVDPTTRPYPGGRARARPPANLCEHFGVQEYFEHTFPQQSRRSNLGRAVGLDILVAFDITGKGGGQWSYRWQRGELVEVQRGIAAGAAVIYRTDVATFAAIIDRRQSPQDAFFAERIAIDGDLETALKLVVLFKQFLREQAEVPDAAVA